jgi:hypothetical protein
MEPHPKPERPASKLPQIAIQARRSQSDHRDGAQAGQTNLQNDETEYVNKGMAAYESKYRQQQMKWLAKQAASLNLQLIPAHEVTG